jgi:hypothetical protein
MMKERMSKELELLRAKYPNLQHGENYDWILIPDFPLLEGWNRQQTKLLFIIPPTYPHTSPDNFYVESGLRLANGNMPGSYSEGAGVPVGGTWGCFSWHAEAERWHSSDTIKDGDNLLTFMRAVNIRLREID